VEIRFSQKPKQTGQEINLPKKLSYFMPKNWEKVIDGDNSFCFSNSITSSEFSLVTKLAKLSRDFIYSKKASVLNHMYKPMVVIEDSETKFIKNSAIKDYQN
tara:strand:- start:153 stop:458 length:306 start_codon:yes stop_codon:yes gene_type:complete